MGIWIGMAVCLWIFVLLSRFFYGGWSSFCFSVFDGLLLAFLCFWVMPDAFMQNCYWAGVIGSLFGVCLGAAVEQKSSSCMISSFYVHVLHSLVFSGAVFLGVEQMPLFGSHIFVTSLVLSCLGGLFLFSACSGILPENCSMHEKLIQACGGLIGFIVGVLLLCRF